MDDIVTTKKAAEMLGVGFQRMHQFIKEGKIAQTEYQKIGHSLFISKASVLALVEVRAQEADERAGPRVCSNCGETYPQTEAFWYFRKGYIRQPCKACYIKRYGK